MESIKTELHEKIDKSLEKNIDLRKLKLIGYLIEEIEELNIEDISEIEKKIKEIVENKKRINEESILNIKENIKEDVYLKLFREIMDIDDYIKDDILGITESDNYHNKPEKSEKPKYSFISIEPDEMSEGSAKEIIEEWTYGIE